MDRLHLIWLNDATDTFPGPLLVIAELERYSYDGGVAMTWNELDFLSC